MTHPVGMKSTSYFVTRRKLLSALLAAGSGAAYITSISAAETAVGNNIFKSAPLSCGRYTDQVAMFKHASDKALNWLLTQLHTDGSFGPAVNELTGYFKVAYLFCISGQLEQANRLITHIESRFMQPNGDFKISPTNKSLHVDYYEKVWGYANAWIAFIAQKLGRFDVSYPAYQYLEKLYHPGVGGYISTDPDSNSEPVIDLLSTTHIGMTSLYLGELDRAEACVDLVVDFEWNQPDLAAGMFLRMNDRQQYLTEFPENERAYYFLSATEANQLYFMAGYPVAFLGLLYRQTMKPLYLSAARRYFDFAVNCEGVYESHFSHKVAWGAAIMYNITGERRYVDFAIRIANLLVELQHESGAWFHDQPPYVSYDQTAECASWLRQISSEICDK